MSLYEIKYPLHHIRTKDSIGKLYSYFIIPGCASSFVLKLYRIGEFIIFNCYRIFFKFRNFKAQYREK